MYEKINESDWWWWFIAIDINDGLLKTGETLYQYITMTDSANASYTVGCAIKIGTDGETISYFKHPASKPDELLDASAEVTGKTHLAQAADLKEEQDDIKWKSGTTHVPTANQAPASTTAGNTNRACYFYEELPKIGRNPKDFDKALTIKFGARIYASDTATTFDSVPATSESIKKGALPSYVSAATSAAVAPSGAMDLVMALASFFMVFSILY